MPITRDTLAEVLCEHLYVEAAFADTKEDIKTAPLNTQLGVDLHGLGNAISFTLKDLQERHRVTFLPKDLDDIGFDPSAYYPQGWLKSVLHYVLPFVQTRSENPQPELYFSQLTDAIWAKVPETDRA